MSQPRQAPVDGDFSVPPGPQWKRVVTKTSRLEAAGGVWRFVNTLTHGDTYTNAQIDGYQGVPRSAFPWQPPLTLTVEARFTHPDGHLCGTAGFGFWNDPFLMTGLRLPALPQAVWFFYGSPPTNLKLAVDVPGRGWKAAALDAKSLPAPLLLPLAPLAVPLMNVPPLYRALWPLAGRALRISEALVPAEMTAWHAYRIEWGVERVRFLVDGAPILEGPSPRGPLGFVMWNDNQAMVATPQGQFRWRTLPVPGEQAMEVRALRITPG